MLEKGGLALPKHPNRRGDSPGCWGPEQDPLVTKFSLPPAWRRRPQDERQGGPGGRLGAAEHEGVWFLGAVQHRAWHLKADTAGPPVDACRGWCGIAKLRDIIWEVGLDMEDTDSQRFESICEKHRNGGPGGVESSDRTVDQCYPP